MIPVRRWRARRTMTEPGNLLEQISKSRRPRRHAQAFAGPEDWLPWGQEDADAIGCAPMGAGCPPGTLPLTLEGAPVCCPVPDAPVQLTEAECRDREIAAADAAREDERSKFVTYTVVGSVLSAVVTGVVSWGLARSLR